VRVEGHTDRGTTLALPVETTFTLPLIAQPAEKGMLAYLPYDASAAGLSVSLIAHAADTDFGFMGKGRYVRWLGVHNARCSDS
jgi:hypothetical protein